MKESPLFDKLDEIKSRITPILNELETLINKESSQMNNVGDECVQMLFFATHIAKQADGMAYRSMLVSKMKAESLEAMMSAMFETASPTVIKKGVKAVINAAKEELEKKGKSLSPKLQNKGEQIILANMTNEEERPEISVAADFVLKKLEKSPELFTAVSKRIQNIIMKKMIKADGIPEELKNSIKRVLKDQSPNTSSGKESNDPPTTDTPNSF